MLRLDDNTTIITQLERKKLCRGERFSRNTPTFMIFFLNMVRQDDNTMTITHLEERESPYIRCQKRRCNGMLYLEDS
jgi:hypothetical protein